MPRPPIGEKAMTPAERQQRHRDIVTVKPITKSEREDLAKLIRNREKVMKSAASERSAELVAEFEQQMASIYSYV
jgi:arginyl-tRNA synthetase